MDDWCDLQRTLDDNNKQLWRVVKFLVQTFQRSWGLREEEKLERGAEGFKRRCGMGLDWGFAEECVDEGP